MIETANYHSETAIKYGMNDSAEKLRNMEKLNRYFEAGGLERRQNIYKEE